MNCHSFESIINDLARDQIMDAEAKASAHAHAKECERCSARLADEIMLTAGLKRLAAKMESEQAAPSVEAALVAAFRRRQAEAAVTTRAGGWLRWAVAASIALIIVVVALVMLRVEKQSPPARAKEGVAPQSQPQIGNQSTEPTPENSLSGDKQMTANATGNQAALKQTQRVNRRKNETAKATAQLNPQNKDDALSKDKDAMPVTAEIATDFIPLIQSGNLTRMEGGQVVRVEMPRSALAQFGLPINLERAGERIKADVVVGNDGLARAIRFVR